MTTQLIVSNAPKAIMESAIAAHNQLYATRLRTCNPNLVELYEKKLTDIFVHPMCLANETKLGNVSLKVSVDDVQVAIGEPYIIEGNNIDSFYVACKNVQFRYCHYISRITPNIRQPFFLMILTHGHSAMATYGEENCSRYFDIKLPEAATTESQKPMPQENKEVFTYPLLPSEDANFDRIALLKKAGLIRNGDSESVTFTDDEIIMESVYASLVRLVYIINQMADSKIGICMNVGVLIKLMSVVKGALLGNVDSSIPDASAKYMSAYYKDYGVSIEVKGNYYDDTYITIAPVGALSIQPVVHTDGNSNFAIDFVNPIVDRSKAMLEYYKSWCATPDREPIKMRSLPQQESAPVQEGPRPIHPGGRIVLGDKDKFSFDASKIADPVPNRTAKAKTAEAQKENSMNENKQGGTTHHVETGRLIMEHLRKSPPLDVKQPNHPSDHQYQSQAWWDIPGHLLMNQPYQPMPAPGMSAIDLYPHLHRTSNPYASAAQYDVMRSQPIRSFGECEIRTGYGFGMEQPYRTLVQPEIGKGKVVSFHELCEFLLSAGSNVVINNPTVTTAKNLLVVNFSIGNSFYEVRKQPGYMFTLDCIPASPQNMHSEWQGRDPSLLVENIHEAECKKLAPGEDIIGSIFGVDIDFNINATVRRAKNNKITKTVVISNTPPTHGVRHEYVVSTHAMNTLLVNDFLEVLAMLMRGRFDSDGVFSSKDSFGEHDVEVTDIWRVANGLLVYTNIRSTVIGMQHADTLARSRMLSLLRGTGV